MRIFGRRIIKETSYVALLDFRDQVEEILRKKLPLVKDATLKNKNITLSRGCVLVNSQIVNSKIDYKSKEAIQAFYDSTIQGCIFNKEK